MTAPKLAPRQVKREGGHYREDDSIPEEDLAKWIGAMLVPKSHMPPVDTFLLLTSRHRNGNTTFLNSIRERLPIPKSLIFTEPKLFDPTQYPLVVKALFPDFHQSARRRQAFFRKLQSRGQRLLRSTTLVILPALALLALELAAVIFTELDRATKPTWPAILNGCLSLPWHLHVTMIASVAVALAMEKYREVITNLITYTSRQPRPSSPRLTPNALSRLAEPPALDRLVEELERRTRSLPLVWIDRADSLDQLSLEVLLRTFAAAPLTNRIFIIHVPPEDSLILRAFQSYSHSNRSNKRQRWINLHLKPVALQHRITVAEQYGRTHKTAAACELVADLVEEDSAFIRGLSATVHAFLAEEEGTTRLGPGTLLAVMATASSVSPRRFSRKELLDLFAVATSTFGRWLAVVDRKPFVPHEVESYLGALGSAQDYPLVTVENSPAGRIYVVQPEACKVVRERIAEIGFWLGGVHGFWASYAGDRFTKTQQELASSQDATLKSATEGVDSTILELRELAYHVTRCRLPLDADIYHDEALGRLAASLLRASRLALAGLINVPLFRSAEHLLRQLNTYVLSTLGPWKHRPFVAEVENLSREVWRLAIVHGASKNVVDFQRVLKKHSRRAEAKGIQSSSLVHEAFLKAAQLEPFDVKELEALPIAGGDAVTRTALRNLRSYTLNIALFWKHAGALECLESHPKSYSSATSEIIADVNRASDANKFSLLDCLVRLQELRLAIAFDDRPRVQASMEALGARLTSADKGDRPRWECLEGTLRSLVLADCRICLLTAHFLHHHTSVAAELEFFFGTARGDRSPLDLLKMTAEGLEETKILSALIEADFVSAHQLNCELRFQNLQFRLTGTEPNDTVWQAAAQKAQALDLRFLWLGSLIARGAMPSHAETAANCLKEACLEFMRHGNVRPLRCLAPDLADLTNLVPEADLQEVAQLSLRQVYESLEASESGREIVLERAGLARTRAQLLRHLSRPEEASEQLDAWLSFDPWGLPDVSHVIALELYLSIRLERMWLDLKLGNKQIVADILSDATSRAVKECWRGLPHLIVLEMMAQPEDASHVGRLVQNLRREGQLRHFESHGLSDLSSRLLSWVKKGYFEPEPREDVLSLVRDFMELMDDRIGLSDQIDLLDAALLIPELSQERFLAKKEDLVRREAESRRRYEWFRNNLNRGASAELLDHLLNRFNHRLSSSKTPDPQIDALERNLDEFGIGSLTSEHMTGLVERAWRVRRHGGLIEVDRAVMFLMRLEREAQREESTDFDLPKIRSALLYATRDLLRLIAKENLVQPGLAKVMLGYLELVEQFELV